MSPRACRESRGQPIPFDCKSGADHSGVFSPFTHRPSPTENRDGHAALPAMSKSDRQC